MRSSQSYMGKNRPRHILTYSIAETWNSAPVTKNHEQQDLRYRQEVKEFKPQECGIVPHPCKCKAWLLRKDHSRISTASCRMHPSHRLYPTLRSRNNRYEVCLSGNITQWGWGLCIINASIALHMHKQQFPENSHCKHRDFPHLVCKRHYGMPLKTDAFSVLQAN